MASRGGAAFTLLELLVCIVIVAILSVMLVGSYDRLRAMAEGASCEQNLKSLHVAANAYVGDQGTWPQIDPRLLGGDGKQYARQWIATLERYHVSPKTWICPTVQRQLRNPDFLKAENIRVDYIATPFGPEPRIAYRWATQPWFIERGNPHDGGNRLIFSDGRVSNMKEVRTLQPTSR